MSSKEKNIIVKRIVRSYITSVISISLVLLLVGIFGILAVNAKEFSNYFKENIKITAVMNSDINENDAKKFEAQLHRFPFVNKTQYVSKEQGTEEMKKILGEDFLTVFETNPIPISIDIQLNPEYFVGDSIAKIKDVLMETQKVEEVVYEEPLIKMLNSNLQRIGTILIVFICLLMFISFVLINNTVRINVYAKRFTIYTMKLVGATKGFIMAPFILKSVFQGLFAGLLANIWLLGVLYAVRSEFTTLFNVLDVKILVLVISGLILSGVFICAVCTFFVINKLISLTNDELYY